MLSCPKYKECGDLQSSSQIIKSTEPKMFAKKKQFGKFQGQYRYNCCIPLSSIRKFIDKRIKFLKPTSNVIRHISSSYPLKDLLKPLLFAILTVFKKKRRSIRINYPRKAANLHVEIANSNHVSYSFV